MRNDEVFCPPFDWEYFAFNRLNLHFVETWANSSVFGALNFGVICYGYVVNQVVMSFHACVDTSVNIPLPNWVRRIGKTEDLFYKDAYGNACTEYLSWAVDQELVLKDRYGNPVSPLQVIN